MVRVTVDGTDTYGNSTSIGLGTDEEGRRVLWLGDARMMHRIQEALDSGESPVIASVPRWAMLHTGSTPDDAS